jgi:hypothetical protein
MRTPRSILVIACAILALGALAPVASAASTPIPLHITKDCSGYTGDKPSFCKIAVSNLDAIPPGSKIWYLGPVLTNSYFLSSNVRLDNDKGDTAIGYCIFQARTSIGLCTFWAGTGKLVGFTAIADVTIDAEGLWHLDGTYYFEDVPKLPETSTEAPGPVAIHHAGHDNA